MFAPVCSRLRTWAPDLTPQAQAYVTDTPGNPQSASSFETNTAAYVEVIVIPLLLFILMVGVVRSRRV